MSLMSRVFVINAGLIVVPTLALALSPATVSSELLVHEVVVLTVGLPLVLVLNFLLIRRSLDPLERLRRSCSAWISCGREPHSAARRRPRSDRAGRSLQRDARAAGG